MKIRFRFSLRALMIATTLCGLVLALFGMQMREAMQQKQAVAWVLEQGGYVSYDSGELHFGFPISGPTEINLSSKPSWLTRLLGQDFFEEVHWASFDNPKELFQLNPLTELKSLSIQGKYHKKYGPSDRLLDFSTVKGLDDLKKIDVSGLKISGLGSQTQLQELNLSDCHSDDYSSLRQLKHLQKLYILDGKLSEISFAERLQELTSIDLCLPMVTDITSLSALKNLREVKIYCTKTTELPSLKNWQKVYHFDIEHTGVSDITPLADLTDVRDLELNSTKISDLSPLADLQDLRRLDIGQTQVTDLTPLYGLKKLEHLSVRNTQVTKTEIKRLQQQLPGCIIYDSIP